MPSCLESYGEAYTLLHYILFYSGLRFEEALAILSQARQLRAVELPYGAVRIHLDMLGGLSCGSQSSSGVIWLGYVVKRIKGRLYVYEQYRRDGKVVTKYIGSLESIVDGYKRFRNRVEGCSTQLVGPGGFEPPTARLSAGRSTWLSYGP